jgi:non-ribosomal peptide synthetase component F
MVFECSVLQHLRTKLPSLFNATTATIHAACGDLSVFPAACFIVLAFLPCLHEYYVPCRLHALPVRRELAIDMQCRQ